MLALHVGPHKTATTYIQDVLNRNTKVLGRAGWVYPEIASGTFRGAHHDIAHEPKAYLTEGTSQNALLSTVREIKANTVLSAEGFRSWDGAQFDLLADYLGAETYDVVYVIRDPISLFWSHWAEEVKQGYAASLAERFADNFNDPMRSQLLNPMLDIGRFRSSKRMRLRVVPFDLLQAEKIDIALHVAEVGLGLGPLPLKTEKARNVRMPIELTELIRLVTLVQGKGARRTSSAFRLKFMEITKGTERHAMVRQIREEGQAARRAVGFKERPAFLDSLQETLVAELDGSWTMDVANRDLFPEPKLRSACYNAAILLDIPAIRDLVNDVIARVDAAS